MPLPETPLWAFSEEDQHFMALALRHAEEAAEGGDVPVGAVVVGPRGELLAAAGNRRQRDQDPTAHAEILALRQAAQALGSWRLVHCTLYVTVEPCPMCAAACVLARLGQLVYGAKDPKLGFVGSLANLLEDPRLHHRVAWRGGLLADQAAGVLQAFFAKRRKSR
ncbi:MAG: tRNA adenosine(34) deaminase TadA [Thermoanaerobaculum sp.]|nr:tRNA adenosine(34) deaminase TadA [Thermoanaerobaculum sp.]MDW7968095.1 tRNA adenosine(34) deaminase TadA [Thermoanaerobaculum sp.]